MKINDKVYGFTVKNIRFSEELDGNLVEMTHDATGLELAWLDNKQKNKLFSVTMKTLPSDSTGVFHILEHSVLCGSDKFPVKEPFVDLLKSSMHTFLNAMTFQDKTMYPVSSRNDRDFLNLTEVYLDAVFAPMILKNKNIFYQEGWHIEQSDGELSYKGVVFNEMKGAMADKDELVVESLLPMLFPDNCYGFNSGGDPEVIPSLSYEKFIETYKKFYHPSNARIYLDGDIPFDETMKLISSYLEGFDRSLDLPQVQLQSRKSAEKTIYYSLGDDEELKDKGRLTLAKIVSKWDEPVKSLAASVVMNALSDSNDSVFKKALFENDLAEDLEIVLNDEAAQSFVTIDIKNIKDGKEKEVVKILKEAARLQCEKGIDRKALVASINSLEFRTKAPEEPAGLMRAMKSMLSWLYGGDPMMYLVCDEYFKKLRELLDTDYYEKLLHEMVLDEEGLCILHARPSYDASKKKDDDEKRRLDEIKASWNDADFADNKSLNEKLVLWQQTQDRPEDSAKIPMLKLSDIENTIDYPKTFEEKLFGARVLYHPLQTNGIVHFNLYFSFADKRIEDFPALASLKQFLSFLGAGPYDALELEQEIKTYIGNLCFYMAAFSKDGDTKKTSPYLIASCSVLEENLDKAKELLHTILTATVFDKAKMLNLLKQADLSARQMPVAAGHSLGKMAACAGLSSKNAVNDAIAGYGNLIWTHKICDEYEERFEDYKALLEDALSKACVQNRMILSYSYDHRLDFGGFISGFDAGDEIDFEAEYHANLPQKMACRIPAQVGFAVQADHLDRLGCSYHGSLAIAANILSLDYLWNEVRVQGGAYGTGIRAGSDGTIFTYSYRDPNLKNSIEVNKAAGNHLRKLCEQDENIDKYIISAVSATDPLLSAQMKTTMVDRDYLSKYTEQDIMLQRDQMLKTTKKELLWAADVIDKFASNGNLCIVGPEDKISEFNDVTVMDI